MNSLTNEEYNRILEKGLYSVYQPIVSVKKKTVSVFESLARAKDSSGRTVNPGTLFSKAEETGTLLELDRQCRKAALQGFKGSEAHLRGSVLSININSSILESAYRSDHLLRSAEESGIAPSQIMIEILESQVKDDAVLIDFVRRYREYGFLIAIDDIGSGFSSLERIILLKPDIIKIDMSLVQGISGSFYRREIVKAITAMGHGTGSIIVAEGVENIEDSAECLRIGADLLQGFYFSKPQESPEAPESVAGKMLQAADMFREQMLERVRETHIRHIRYDNVISSIIEILSALSPNDFHDTLEKIIHKMPAVECVYIIDSDGIQISETFCKELPDYSRCPLFSPDPKGTDQSYKDYFFYLKTGLKRYTSPVYLSTASGNLCTTISAPFVSADGIPYVLCCDMLGN